MSHPAKTVDRHDELDAVAERITEISTLPEVALRVMKVADDPDAGALDILRVVENDPPLCSRILRTLRSAQFGFKAEITDLRHAIAYLGFKQIRNLAMAGSVSRIFQSEMKVGTYRRVGLWKHLVSVALAARMMASRLHVAEPEDAFLAGLMHDLGIVLIDQNFNNEFVRVLEDIKEGASLSRIEQGVLGFDHGALGAAVATRWGFPGFLVDGMRYHHRMGSYAGDRADLLACVDVANFLCSMLGYTSVGTSLVRPPLDSLALLELTKNDLQVFGEDLTELLADSSHMFQL